ncbi:MAG: hypothetical protein WA208_06080 [Thermoanaerobaculia bacterium]
MKKSLGVAVLVLALAVPATSQEVCPCVPVTYVWIASACETWNCAQSAMILANGDPYVVSMPTGGSKYAWVIVKRVPAGSATVSPDDPFVIEPHGAAADAANRMAGVDPARLPMLVTTVDGKALVVHLRDPDPARRRAVRP